MYICTGKWNTQGRKEASKQVHKKKNNNNTKNIKMNQTSAICNHKEELTYDVVISGIVDDVWYIYMALHRDTYYTICYIYTYLS